MDNLAVLPRQRNLERAYGGRDNPLAERGCCAEFCHKIWTAIQSFFYYLFCCCLFTRNNREPLNHAEAGEIRGEGRGVVHLTRAPPIQNIQRRYPEGYRELLEETRILPEGAVYNLSMDPTKNILEDPRSGLKETFALGKMGAGDRPVLNKKMIISLPPYALTFFPSAMQAEFSDLADEALHLHIVIHVLDDRFPFEEEEECNLNLFAQPIVKESEARFLLAFSDVQNSKTNERQNTFLRVNRFVQQEVGYRVNVDDEEEQLFFFPNNSQIILTNPELSAFYTAIDMQGEEERKGVAAFNLVIREDSPFMGILGRSQNFHELAENLARNQNRGIQKFRELLTLPIQ